VTIAARAITSRPSRAQADPMNRPPVLCDHFLADVQPALAYRIDFDTFPILTDPEFVGAAEAGFMRADDWVVGVRVGDRARCYPAHMVDNVHVVNDVIDGVPYAVMHCEVCCSNAAYLATLGGERITFGTGGLFGGSLTVFDEGTRSIWSHGMGVAFDGPLTGTSLERVESFQASYAEWLALHPDTEVMVWPEPALHPDARHGHGTDAWFALPGIEPLVLRTMAVENDDRLPEADIVVSVFTAAGHAAVPLQELIRAGGLLAGEVNGEEFVSLSGGPDSALSGTFRPHLAGRPEARVVLEVDDGRFVDRRTGSAFRVDGLAVSGELAGSRLHPVPTMTNKWHSLTCFVPGVPIVRAPGGGANPAEGELAPVLDALRSDGYAVKVTRRLYALEMPQEARCGFAVELDGDPCNVYLFSDESVAEDQLLWTPHACHAGAVVLVSTPPLYADLTNTKRFRPAEIAWSPLMDDAGLHLSLYRAACNVPSERAHHVATLTELVEGMRARGISVAVRRSAYRETLPVGALTGMVADVEGDPFTVLRFARAEDAALRAPLPSHSIVAGHFVLQSDPADVYANRERGTQRRPDDSISWSPLLRSESFRAHVLDAAGVPAETA
jgi:hypothetical protein